MDELFDNVSPIGVFGVMRCRAWGRGRRLVTSFVWTVGVAAAGPRMHRKAVDGWNAAFTRRRDAVRGVHWYQRWRYWFDVAIEWKSEMRQTLARWGINTIDAIPTLTLTRSGVWQCKVSLHQQSNATCHFPVYCWRYSAYHSYSKICVTQEEED